MPMMGRDCDMDHAPLSVGRIVRKLSGIEIPNADGAEAIRKSIGPPPSKTMMACARPGFQEHVDRVQACSCSFRSFPTRVQAPATGGGR